MLTLDLAPHSAAGRVHATGNFYRFWGCFATGAAFCSPVAAILGLRGRSLNRFEIGGGAAKRCLISRIFATVGAIEPRTATALPGLIVTCVLTRRSSEPEW